MSLPPSIDLPEDSDSTNMSNQCQEISRESNGVDTTIQDYDMAEDPNIDPIYSSTPDSSEVLNSDQSQDSVSDEASQQDSEKPIEGKHLNTFRLMMILGEEARPIMESVFLRGASQKSENITLKEYLMDEKGISNAQYRKIFDRTSREKIESDPSCKSFDISLLLPAIEWGCEGLAAPHHHTWNDSPESLENHLKKIKDARNDVMHNMFNFTDSQFFDKVEDLRTLLSETMKLAGEKYNTDEGEVNEAMTTLDRSICRIRDSTLSCIEFEDYTYTPLTNKLRILFLNKGVKDLKSLSERMTYVNPSSSIAGSDRRLKVKIIFTELEIIKSERYEEKETIDHTDLLNYANGSSIGQIILIEGNAGVGKTTLLKLFLSSWASGETLIKGLDHFQFVIYTECKNNRISSLSELISIQMPTVRKSFRTKDHMRDIFVDFPVLIMIDGLDEMNLSSKKLFQEIVNIKKIENLTIICTTRPEKVQDYHRMVPDDVHSLHVKIKGIPEHCMEKFLIKYYDELCDTDDIHQDRQALLNYFRSSEVCLRDHWRIPLNLTLLALLWVVNPESVNTVTTAVELYERIHELTVENLVKKMLKEDHELSSKTLKRNIDVYIAALCREAFAGLRDDAIILKPEAVHRLEELCTHLEISQEQTISAFLTQENIWQPTTSLIQSSFHHKGIQDFYASRFIHAQMTGSSLPFSLDHKQSLITNFSSCQSLQELPSHLHEELIKTTWETIQDCFQRANSSNCTIEKVLKNLYGQPLDQRMLGNIQNVLVLLIGLMYLTENDIAERFAEELIELLKKSGLDNKPDAWIQVLNSVKCNKHIVKLIARIPNLFANVIEIFDSNTFAYASLLETIHPKAVKITIRICPFHVPRLNELFEHILRHKCRVRDLSLEFFYRCSSNDLEDSPLEDNIVQIMKKCKLEKYKGNLTPKMALPKTLNDLSVSVSDAESYKVLHRFLVSGCDLRNFRVCLNRGIDPAYLHPMPSRNIVLYLPDIANEADIEKAYVIAKKLQGMDTKKFSNILFPRCTLTPEEQRTLITRFQGVKVEWAVYFPAKDHYPSSQQEKDDLKEFAKEHLQCRNGVIWGGFGIDEWEESQ